MTWKNKRILFGENLALRKVSDVKLYRERKTGEKRLFYLSVLKRSNNHFHQLQNLIFSDYSGGWNRGPASQIVELSLWLEKDAKHLWCVAWRYFFQAKHLLRSKMGDTKTGRAILGKKCCNIVGKISGLWQTLFMWAVNLLCRFLWKTLPH